MTVTAVEHAARLRLFRRMIAMLEHPEADEVMTDEQREKIEKAVMVIRQTTPISAADELDFIEHGLRDIRVVTSEKTGKKVFAFVEDKAQ